MQVCIVRYLAAVEFTVWFALGSGGLTVASQIYNRFKAAGKPLNEGDIAIVDAAEYHFYQVRQLPVVPPPYTYHTLFGSPHGECEYHSPLLL